MKAATETSTCKTTERSDPVPNTLGGKPRNNRHDAHWPKRKQLPSICYVESSRSALYRNPLTQSSHQPYEIGTIVPSVADPSAGAHTQPLWALLLTAGTRCLLQRVALGLPELFCQREREPEVRRNLSPPCHRCNDPNAARVRRPGSLSSTEGELRDAIYTPELPGGSG